MITRALSPADQDLLQKLLLGQLSGDEVERLAAEYSDDSRLAELAESLAGTDHAFQDLLRSHESPVDADSERRVDRLLARLQRALPVNHGDETAALNLSGAVTKPSLPASAQEPPLPERLEYYRPIKVLGQGGMGTVYLAEDTRLGRQVAIKTLRLEWAADSQAKERFLREARSAARLEHDHIVAIYYVGEADGIPFLAMPLLQGEPLDALLARTTGPLPVAFAMRLAREAASGLAAAHARGLIHRDIKPANLWLESQCELGMTSEPGASATGAGRIKILDFGLAKSAGREDEPQGTAPLTACGVMVGTPSYMAPEQASGNEVDARADLFSLGCVMYEMLAGKRPFTGANIVSILTSLAVHTPPAPHTLNAHCSVGLSQLVMRLLEKEPANRVASAQELIKALAELEKPPASSVLPASVEPVELPARIAVAKSNVASRPTSKVTPVRTHSRPMYRMAMGAAVCLLALVGGGILFGGQVIRIVTNQGQIVVEVDDPEIEVAVKQDGLKVVDPTTKREFTLSAHNGQVLVVDKDGLELLTKEFTLRRGGKSRVRVSLDELAAARDLRRVPPTDLVGPAAKPLPDKEKPFVLARTGGKQRDEFQSLDGALTALNDGDVIELHGNGPFTLGLVNLRDKGLRMKAAPGYRPQIVLSKKAVGDWWFAIVNGAVDVEGCDFRCGNGVSNFAYGSGPSWEFRSCRLLGAQIGFIAYTGPKLTFQDCLISGFDGGGHGGFGPGLADSVLEMKNTIYWTRSYQLLNVPGNDRAKYSWQVNLQHNTFHANCSLTGIPQTEYGKTTLEATANIFQLAGIGDTQVMQANGGWVGRENLYVGPVALGTLLKDAKEPIHGLSAWQKFWGEAEKGGRETDWAHFAWDEARRLGHEPQGVIQALAPVTAALTKQHGVAFKELGPQWELVGPGKGYVRALAAAGKSVGKEKLRPAPHEDGPFVLLRGEKVVGGYANLGEAAAVAVSGDTIEIRTDDPSGRYAFAGEQPRLLTVRAAPGYLPVIDGGLDFASKNLSLIIEGLHFRNGPLGTAQYFEGPRQNAIVRLANCSFASETDFTSMGGRVPRNGVFHPRFEGADGKPGEIINCLIPGIVVTSLPAKGKLIVRNSVVGAFRMHLNSPGERELELERCVLWNPGSDSPALEVATTDAVKNKAQMTVTARHTLFEPGSKFINFYAGAELKAWQGSGNVYRVGHRAWVTEEGKLGSIGLADWRLRWKSDADSIEADPVDYDPQQWRLLPSSAGYQAGLNGKDLGADVSRIGTVEPVDPKVRAQSDSTTASESSESNRRATP